MGNGMERVIEICNAFSCVVTRRKKVIWKFGTDSHDDLLKIAKIDDNSRDPKTITFCRVEISPENKDYLNPDARYKFKVDMDFTPAWWTEDHEKVAWLAFQKWKKQLDTILVQKPIVHPFNRIPPEITDKHIRLLQQWDSVWAYTGTFFILPRSAWKYTENIDTEEYPFQCLATLWEQGLVPSFDGTTWRLHGGKDAKILYTITKEELMKK